MKITSYGFQGSIGFIETEIKTIYLDWRCLQNILNCEDNITNRKIEYVNGQIFFKN